MPRPKKSETLEVRLPFETKRAFMARCRSEGRSASDVVRGAIDDYLNRPARPPTPRWRSPMKALKTATVPVALAGVAGLALFAAHPSRAAPDLKAAFERLDADNDGRVGPDEFTGSPDIVEVVQRPQTPPNNNLAENAPKPVRFLLRTELQPQGAARDPIITPGYAQETGRRRFSAIDRNQDGAASYGEFRTHHLAVMAETFAAIDSDGNGRLSASEFAAAPKPPGPQFAFESLDRDRNRAISADEFEALL